MIKMSRKHCEALSRCSYFLERSKPDIANPKFAAAVQDDVDKLNEIKAFITLLVNNPELPFVKTG